MIEITDQPIDLAEAGMVGGRVGDFMEYIPGHRKRQ
jgi:hypothetical protein